MEIARCARSSCSLHLGELNISTVSIVTSGRSYWYPDGLETAKSLGGRLVVSLKVTVK